MITQRKFGFALTSEQEADRSAELMGRLRRAIAEMGDIEAAIVVTALLGVLGDLLGRVVRIGRAELEVLGHTILPAVVDDWRRVSDREDDA